MTGRNRRRRTNAFRTSVIGLLALVIGGQVLSLFSGSVLGAVKHDCLGVSPVSANAGTHEQGQIGPSCVRLAFELLFETPSSDGEPDRIESDSNGFQDSSAAVVSRTAEVSLAPPRFEPALAVALVSTGSRTRRALDFLRPAGLPDRLRRLTC